MSQAVYGGLFEDDANIAIAEWLQEVQPHWQAQAERTGNVRGRNDRPDIIIRQGDRMPVVIECEWGKPAVGDAIKRLGETLLDDTRAFTEVIAVGIPEECRGDSHESFRRLPT